VAYNWAHPLL